MVIDPKYESKYLKSIFQKLYNLQTWMLYVIMFQCIIGLYEKIMRFCTLSPYFCAIGVHPPPQRIWVDWFSAYGCLCMILQWISVFYVKINRIQQDLHLIWIFGSVIFKVCSVHNILWIDNGFWRSVLKNYADPFLGSIFLMLQAAIQRVGSWLLGNSLWT